MSETTDLAVWLTAVWDEEERLAAECVDEVGSERTGDPFPDGSGDADKDAFPSYPWGSEVRELAFMAGPGHPASVLARIAADRKILALHSGDNDEPCQSYAGNWTYEPCETLRLLAEPHADKPGFRSKWLVERQGVEQ